MDARKWDEYYETNTDPWTRPDDDLVAAAASMPAGRALDLGAGEGADSIWLARQGWEVTAVGRSAAAVATLRRLAASEGLAIRAEVADVADYRVEKTYDLVLICHMHLPAHRRARVLTNAAVSLAPGGVLLLIGIPPPGDPDEAQRSGGLLATPDEFVDELGGLTVERCEVRRRTVGSPEGDLCSDVMLIRARRTVPDRAGDAVSLEQPADQTPDLLPES